MAHNPPVTILCLASYFKGHDFIREAHRLGCRVLLVTSESLRDAPWPRACIAEMFYVPDVNKKWKLDDLLLGVSHLARREVIDRIVPLDDFDLERASALREHLRIPGMGETTTRYFRDKLAMRVKAASDGLPVPGFVHVLNEERIRSFCARVSPPWFLKPRQQAGAIGIRKINTEDELWAVIAELGDRSSHYLLETFVPGDVYHVDSIVYEREVRLAVASCYGTPPFDVSQGGGVFTSCLVLRGTAEERDLLDLNRRVLTSLGLVRGVSHSEYIRGRDGQVVFLETSARVGGAHLADLVEAGTGLNLWAEWARIEKAGGEAPYSVHPSRADYAGLIVSLARQEWPSLEAYVDPEVVWRLDKRHHAGLIVRSPSFERVQQLLADYAGRFTHDFAAMMPAREAAAE
jgi:biotin carboxylase